MAINYYEIIVFLTEREYFWLVSQIIFAIFWLLIVAVVSRLIPQIILRFKALTFVNVLIFGILIILNLEVAKFGFFEPYTLLAICALPLIYFFSIRIISKHHWVPHAALVPIIAYTIIAVMWAASNRIKAPMNKTLSGPVLYRMMAWDPLKIRILRNYFSFSSFNYKQLDIIVGDSWETVYVTPNDFRKCWPEKMEDLIKSRRTMSCALELYRQPLLDYPYATVTNAKMIPGVPKTMK